MRLDQFSQKSGLRKVTLCLGVILLCRAFSLNTQAANGQPQFFDLSLLVAPDLPSTWAGGFPYFQINYYLRPGPLSAYSSDILSIDGNTGTHSGTHLVPPSYALPAEGFDRRNYAPEVQQWLATYEKRYGPRGTSTLTAEKVPLFQSCGWLRVIDIRYLLGKTDKSSWPQSPEIMVADIQKFEWE